MRTIRFIHKLIVIIPVYLLIMAIMLLFAIDVEDLKNIHLIRIALGLLLLYTISHMVRSAFYMFGRWIISRSARDFTPEKQFNRYAECRPRDYAKLPRRDQIVLLLHGFTTSPMEWTDLAERLESEGIDFHAPLIYGFGHVRPDLTMAVCKEDWFRQIVDLYDMFAARYEKVSVIGHSMGGMLACYLGQVRPLHELILSAPALFPDRTNSIYARLIKRKWSTRLFAWYIPMIPKPMRGDREGPADTLDEQATYKYFQYLVAPVRLLISMLQSQRDIDLRALQYHRLTLLSGDKDITVDNKDIEEYMLQSGLSFQHFCFKNSAHNIFVDYDREYANDLAVSLLKNDFEHPDLSCCEYRQFDQTTPREKK